MGKIKKYFKQIFAIDDTPHRIAAGFALGIFLGIVPGEGVIMTLILVSIFRVNGIAAMTGVLATNVWTSLALLPMAAAVGAFLFGIDNTELVAKFIDTYNLGFKHLFGKVILLDVALPLLVGFIVVALLVSLTMYLVMLLFLSSRKKRI